MNKFDILISLNIVDWSTILIGLKRNWLNTEKVKQYAINYLDNDCLDENIMVIASGDFIDKDELVEIIEKITKEENCSDELDKWRLASLIQLSKSNIDDESKVYELQKIYADFSYPEDMICCSIYSDCKKSPILSMNDLIIKLYNKLKN